jgi:hypothetical protein
VDLITVGEAFHRLDQGRVLDLARRWLKPGGVFATMGGTNVLRGSRAWHLALFEVAEEWTRDAFPRGWAPALPGAATDSSALRRLFESHGFVDIADYRFTHAHRWTIDEVLGYVRSMSVCSPAVLGERRAGFEAAVRDALFAIEPHGLFDDELTFGLTIARRPALK